MKFNIIKLETDSDSKIVRTVYWNAIETDGEYKSALYGSTNLNDPSDNFIEFNNITEAKVIEWISALVNVDNIQRQLNNHIQSQKNQIAEVSVDNVINDGLLDPPWATQ
jgi:hypothetical protein